MFPIAWCMQPCHNLVESIHSILAHGPKAKDLHRVLLLRDELNLRLTHILLEAQRYDLSRYTL